MATVPEPVTQLVERFDRNRDSYHAGGINETRFWWQHGVESLAVRRNLGRLSSDYRASEPRVPTKRRMKAKVK